METDKFVSGPKQKKIKQAIKEAGVEKLTAIKEAAGDDVSFDEIRLILAKK